MGIKDKTLLYILKQILSNTPLKYQSHPSTYIQSKKCGIVQSGILYGLFTNIVLNELDKWIESQWQFNPVIYKYSYSVDKKSNMKNYGCGYRAMRTSTSLKEMHLVRFGEDFRVFCAKKDDAIKTLYALEDYISNRLKLNYDKPSCKVVNLKHNYCDFVGFEIMMINQKNKYVVKSRMSEYSLTEWNKLLKNQIKCIEHPKNNKNCFDEIKTYNNMVLSIHNYYKYATHISIDCDRLNWPITIMFKNRLGVSRLSKNGRNLTDFEKSKYGKSKQIRYEKSTNEPIFPIGYIQHKYPIAHKNNSTPYSEEGRKLLISKEEIIKIKLLSNLMKQNIFDNSIEMVNNKINLYIQQNGKCKITGLLFTNTNEIHCHHIVPKSISNDNSISNLVLVTNAIHKLIHCKNNDIIHKSIQELKLNSDQIKKINELRRCLKLPKI